MNIFKKWQNISLSLRILVGLIIAVIIGYLGNETVIKQVSYLGSIYMHLLKIIIVPLVFCSLANGLTSINKNKEIANGKKVALKTVFFFFLTGVIASFVGLLFGYILTFLPISTHLTKLSGFHPHTVKGLGDTIISYIPDNIFKALISNNVISVVVVALLFAFGIYKAGEKAKPVADLLTSTSEITINIARFIIELTPIALLGLIAPTVHKYGISTLLPLINLIVFMYIACFVHLFTVQLSFIRASNLSVKTFLKGVFPALSLAFSSSSSYGTLPMTLNCARKNLGIDKGYSSFSLPLGATINMDACGGIYPVIASLFVAKIYNIDLSLAQYILIMVMAIVTTMGTAGLPGASLVAAATFTAVGIPIEGLAYILVVDRIIDMIRTATNVCGDLAISTYVAKKYNLIDIEVYNNANKESFEIDEVIVGESEGFC